MLKIFDEREIEVSSIIQYAFRVLPMMIGSCIHYIHDHYLFKLQYVIYVQKFSTENISERFVNYTCRPYCITILVLY